MANKAGIDPVTTPAGEGERRAVGGLVRQYDLAARVIYQAIASGELAWLGLRTATSLSAARKFSAVLA